MYTLAAWVEYDGRLPIEEALGWGYRLAISLDKLHGRRLAHGALGTDTILVGDRNPESEGCIIHPSELGEDPRYISQKRGLGGKASARDDMWALAVIVYYCLGGEMPFPEGAVAFPEGGLPSAAPLEGYEKLQPLFDTLLRPHPTGRYLPPKAVAKQFAQVLPSVKALPPLRLLRPGEADQLLQENDDDDDDEPTLMGDASALLAQVAAGVGAAQTSDALEEGDSVDDELPTEVMEISQDFREMLRNKMADAKRAKDGAKGAGAKAEAKAEAKPAPKPAPAHEIDDEPTADEHDAPAPTMIRTAPSSASGGTLDESASVLASNKPAKKTPPARNDFDDDLETVVRDKGDLKIALARAEALQKARAKAKAKSDAEAKEPAAAEPPKAEPPKAEPPKAEPPKAEPPKAEPALDEPPLDEPPLDEPPLADPPLDGPAAKEPPLDEPDDAGDADGGTPSVPAPPLDLADLPSDLEAPPSRPSPSSLPGLDDADPSLSGEHEAAPASAPAPAPVSQAPPKKKKSRGPLYLLVAGLAVAGAIFAYKQTKKAKPAPAPAPTTPAPSAAPPATASATAAATATATAGEAPPAASGSASASAGGDAPSAGGVNKCVGGLFEGSPFEDSQDIGFVCSATSPRDLTNKMTLTMIKGSGGKATHASREWTSGGWYQLAGLAVARGRCCPSPAKLEAPKGLKGCKLDGALAGLIEAGKNKSDVEEARKAFSKAIFCINSVNGANLVGQRSKPTAYEVTVFRRMMKRLE